MTTKYAVDLLSGDRFIPKHSDRVVYIDWISDDEPTDRIVVMGYFEDDGETYDRILDYDSIVKVL